MDLPHSRLLNQRLAGTPSPQPVQTVAWLGAVQAQDYRAALWTVGARTQAATEETIEQALATGKIVRTWLLRGTLHFVAAADVHWLRGLLAPRLLARSTRRFQQLDLDESVVARALALLVEALRGGQHLTRAALYQVLEQAHISTAHQRGYHLLWRAAQEGLLCLGPRSDKQETFTLLDEWVPPTRILIRDEALAELAARYFTSHGPATLADFVWWSGLATAEARAGLEMVQPQLVRELVQGRDYWLPACGPDQDGASSSAYLLPAFDEYLVGYKERHAVLAPSLAKQINPGGGLLAPTIVVDGQVVGVWKRTLKRKAPLVRATLFTRLTPAAAQAVETAAARYGQFVGLPVELSCTQEL
ncbi:MAG: winged helix DNA-binding domain-containing protein [Ardenticatenales bacterium]|nr:winged helix DNA-binding domain-containing protein [Ardenticatenales bacterium]